MIIKVRRSRWIALLALSLLLCIRYIAKNTPTIRDGPMTVELKRLVAANPELKLLLIASIERAKQVDPDPLTNPAQSRGVGTSPSVTLSMAEGLKQPKHDVMAVDEALGKLAELDPHSPDPRRNRGRARDFRCKRRT